MIVADTNLISYLLIEGDHTDLARAVWIRDPEWAMPPLWRSEFLNVLVIANRAGVLDADHASLLWRRSNIFLNATELEPDGEKVLEIAIGNDLSAYDAQFVAVAEELGVLLVTADKRILARCRDRAVSLQEFTSN